MDNEDWFDRIYDELCHELREFQASGKQPTERIKHMHQTAKRMKQYKETWQDG